MVWSTWLEHTTNSAPHHHPVADHCFNSAHIYIIACTAHRHQVKTMPGAGAAVEGVQDHDHGCIQLPTLPPSALLLNHGARGMCADDSTCRIATKLPGMTSHTPTALEQATTQPMGVRNELLHSNQNIQSPDEAYLYLTRLARMAHSCRVCQT